jgi:hypothetical protein
MAQSYDSLNLHGLWQQERTERWQLYRDFREEVEAYHDRMGHVVVDHYHQLESESVNGSALVLRRPVSGVGPYDYISLLATSQPRPGVSAESLRSFSVARHHYALRWRFYDKRVYAPGTAEPEVVEGFDEGPTSHYEASRYGRHVLRTYGNRRFNFEPEQFWAPKLFEREKVRQVLVAAIGVISALGYEEPLVEQSSEQQAMQRLHTV